MTTCEQALGNSGKDKLSFKHEKKHQQNQVCRGAAICHRQFGVIEARQDKDTLWKIEINSE